MKIRPVGAELFHEDRRTDMTKLIVAFRNIAKAPKNGELLFYNAYPYLKIKSSHVGENATYSRKTS